MELKFKYYLSTKKFIFLLCIIILPSISHAQSVGSTGATAVDSLRRQFEKDATQTVADFEEYSKKALEEYEKYGSNTVMTIKIARLLILTKEKSSWKSPLMTTTR